MTGRVQDRVAVVTGGCSGIGLASVQRLAAEGARVVIGDVDDRRGPEVAASVDGLYLRTDALELTLRLPAWMALDTRSARPRSEVKTEPDSP